MTERQMRLIRQRAIVLLIAVAATAYFAHHAIYGRYGLEARRALAERTIIARGKLAGLEAVRADLARDVALLAADPPHPDLAEELARATLGFARPADRVLVGAVTTINR